MCHPRFFANPLFILIVFVVIFPTYAEMRHSGTEGSINFLFLNCTISRLATWGSFQLEVPTSRSSGAACAASALDPRISLSLGLLTSPPIASMWVFMMLAAWVCIALFAWVVPSNVLWPPQRMMERDPYSCCASLANQTLSRSSSSHFHKILRSFAKPARDPCYFLFHSNPIQV